MGRTDFARVVARGGANGLVMYASYYLRKGIAPPQSLSLGDTAWGLSASRFGACAPPPARRLHV